MKAASGNIRGFSFSPDSGSVAFGTAGHNQSFDSPTDLYSFSDRRQERARITRDRKSLNPLWTPAGSSTTARAPEKATAVLQPVRDPA